MPLIVERVSDSKPARAKIRTNALCAPSTVHLATQPLTPTSIDSRSSVRRAKLWDVSLVGAQHLEPQHPHHNVGIVVGSFARDDP
jgi:hypothetical protein